ncbi:MAG: phenylalanine--tRNA ligase subunit alpha, partial [Acidimicrobiia bacterium]|nr:phenylalanine--tRNA ligase subunit alpha [Acidimicrobiia bacterium]
MDLERLAGVIRDARARIEAASDLDELSDAESETLGRRSEIAVARSGIGRLAPDRRRDVGRAINEAVGTLTAAVEDRRSALQAEAENVLLEQDRIDLTLPYGRPARGTHHLLTRTMEDVCDVF